MDLRRYIRDIPDFPKPGILFKDITPLLADGKALRWTIDQLAERYRGTVDIVLGIESRGFIIGAALAYALGVGFAIVRKPGKLPAETLLRQLRARVRHRHARDPPRRVRPADARADRRRSARHRRHRHRRHRAGPSSLQGEIVECAFVIELGVPARPRTPRAAPRALADPLRLAPSVPHRMEGRAPARPLTALSSASPPERLSAVAD